MAQDCNISELCSGTCAAAASFFCTTPGCNTKVMPRRLNENPVLEAEYEFRGQAPVPEIPRRSGTGTPQISSFPLYIIFLRSNFTLTCLPLMQVSNWSFLSPGVTKGVPSGSFRENWNLPPSASMAGGS